MGYEIGYGDYPQLEGVRRVLVIKLRQLGDVLLTGPVFSALKKRLPHAKIDAYVYSESAPLLKEHPGIDGLVCYDRGWKSLSWPKRLWQELRLLKRIRDARYDLVINLTEGERGLFAAKFSKAPIRVGFDPKKKRFQKLYTHRAKNCPSLRHTVERNLDAVRRIGIFPAEEERELFLEVDPGALDRMKRKISGPFILIHPTSRWMFKSWPVQKLQELAERLCADGLQLVFTSGPDSAEMEYIRRATQGLDVVNLSGQLSLEELVALVSLSNLLFCVDSLPFHIASALKKPVVALFGPTSEVTWGAWKNEAATVITLPMSCRPCYQDGCGGSKVSDCLVRISVEEVYLLLLKKMRSSVDYEFCCS